MVCSDLPEIKLSSYRLKVLKPTFTGALQIPLSLLHFFVFILSLKDGNPPQFFIYGLNNLVMRRALKRKISTFSSLASLLFYSKLYSTLFGSFIDWPLRLTTESSSWVWLVAVSPVHTAA